MNVEKFYQLHSNRFLFDGTDGHKYCINPFATQFSMKMKKIMHNMDTKAYYCKGCNLIFDTEEYYEQHRIDSHNDVRKHKCFYCEVSFKRQDHLKRHIQSLHTSFSYPCAICNELLPNRESMFTHMKMKHGDVPPLYKCKDCVEEFTLVSQLEDHEKNSHVVIERPVCPHCSTTFKRRDHMLRHIKSQHLNHSIGCPVCTQQYKRRDHLTRHLREKHNIKALEN